MEEHQTIVWSGTTPLGLPMVLERDAQDRWIATVAGTMRSQNRSAAIAVAEAAGLRTREPWVRLIAGMAVARDPAVAA